MNVYILTITDIDGCIGDWYFSDIEKAAKFIDYNFQYDKPKKISNALYEGKNNIYVINDRIIDQVKI